LIQGGRKPDRFRRRRQFDLQRVADNRSESVPDSVRLTAVFVFNDLPPYAVNDWPRARSGAARFHPQPQRQTGTAAEQVNVLELCHIEHCLIKPVLKCPSDRIQRERVNHGKINTINGCQPQSGRLCLR
jgi:hypothetical protein